MGQVIEEFFKGKAKRAHERFIFIHPYHSISFHIYDVYIEVLN